MSKALTILMAEDSAADQRLAIEAFRDKETVRHLKIVSDGAQALDYLHNAGSVENPFPDLIVLDLNLPCKTGDQVLQEIKADPEFRHIPVAIFSSSSSIDDVSRCYDLFANCYIIKPTELDNFFLVLRALGEFFSTIAEVVGDSAHTKRTPSRKANERDN